MGEDKGGGDETIDFPLTLTLSHQGRGKIIHVFIIDFFSK